MRDGKGFDETSAWCSRCKKRVVARGKPINHVVFLICSIITCGLWLPVWAVQASKSRPWRCALCGSTDIERNEARIEEIEDRRNREPWDASPVTGADITTTIDGTQEGTFNCWVCKTDTLWRRRGVSPWFCSRCGTQGKQP